MQTLLNAAATAISASASFLNSTTFNVEEFEELLTKVNIPYNNEYYLKFSQITLLFRLDIKILNKGIGILVGSVNLFFIHNKNFVKFDKLCLR